MMHMYSVSKMSGKYRKHFGARANQKYISNVSKTEIKTFKNQRKIGKSRKRKTNIVKVQHSTSSEGSKTFVNSRKVTELPKIISGSIVKIKKKIVDHEKKPFM